MINLFQIGLGIYIVTLIASVSTFGPEKGRVTDRPHLGIIAHVPNQP